MWFSWFPPLLSFSFARKTSSAFLRISYVFGLLALWSCYIFGFLIWFAKPKKAATNNVMLYSTCKRRSSWPTIYEGKKFLTNQQQFKSTSDHKKNVFFGQDQGWNRMMSIKILIGIVLQHEFDPKYHQSYQLTSTFYYHPQRLPIVFFQKTNLHKEYCYIWGMYFLCVLSYTWCLLLVLLFINAVLFWCKTTRWRRLYKS